MMYLVKYLKAANVRLHFLLDYSETYLHKHCFFNPLPRMALVNIIDMAKILETARYSETLENQNNVSLIFLPLVETRFTFISIQAQLADHENDPLFLNNI